MLQRLSLNANIITDWVTINHLNFNLDETRAIVLSYYFYAESLANKLVQKGGKSIPLQISVRNPGVILQIELE